MPTLTVKFKDATQGEYTLERGKSLTIGRKEGSDVVIDNMAVSGTHAKIDSLDEGFLLTDLRSKNGTFVNGKLINSHWLKKGDVIVIGKHNLIFDLAEGEAPPPEQDLVEKTMVLDTDEYRAMLDRTSPEVTAQAEKKEPTGVLSFLKGGEGEVEIKKKLIKIGKHSSCDVVVGGFMVAKVAATISKRPTGFYLNFVEGMSKPSVNGKTVKDSTPLKEFDIIEIGSAKMEFIIKE
jgi:pSer/pThr/pTyr-binding forkhead associated (FHA) protein